MKANVNNKEFLIKEHASKPYNFEVNGKPVELDAYTNRNGMLCFLYNNHSYQAELISYNENDKIAVIKLNNTRYEVRLKDDTDLLLEELGITGKTTKIRNIKAPMPGLVLNIKVKEGDEVKKGDGLLVLEAMKMENLIKAQSDGKVKKIYITTGAKVEKNQPLIEME
ncbi:MAG TPA: acetyl-CoA carboxylase biotin carboxyl carrier protein subunit [Bacteroidia bacterium]|nr:acetyl-CoA carboxylase biotin carboxyl carrier protein subunit [Bacteroidia bacterium]